VARINKISITLCALLFTSLTFTPVANASQQARHSAVQKNHLVKATERKKKTTAKNDKKKTTTQTKKTASSKTKTRNPLLPALPTPPKVKLRKPPLTS